MTDTSNTSTTDQPQGTSMLDRMGMVRDMISGVTGQVPVDAANTTNVGADASITAGGITGPQAPKPDSSSDESSSGDSSGTSSTTTKSSAAPMANAGNPKAQDAAANQALAKQKAAAVGWTGAQWDALNNVIMSESGWRDVPNSAGGTAAGIAQNIHGYGPGYEKGNVGQQIDWLISYVQKRYGTPQQAWQHKQDTRGQYGNASGWY